MSARGNKVRQPTIVCLTCVLMKANILFSVLGILLLILIVILILRSGTGARHKPSRKAPAAGGAPYIEKTARAEPAADHVIAPEVSSADPEDHQEELARIEKEMLILRELYDAGHIDRMIFLDETRELYEKAKALS